MLNLQPVVTIILAISFLNEIPSPLQVTGTIFTLAGVYMINYAHQRKDADLPQMESIILSVKHSKKCLDSPDAVLIHI